MRASIMALATVAALAGPATALACPACATAAPEASRQAFVSSTVFLSIMPLAMIAGAALWIRRRVRDGTPPDSASRASVVERCERVRSTFADTP